jgi:hypothetical protein
MHMGINDPAGKYDELSSTFMRLMFQTYNSNSGDKNIPILDSSMSARSASSPMY